MVSRILLMSSLLAVMVGMTTATVLCGGHHAASCEECPQGHGRGWCNGECFWSNGKCIPQAKVLCGGHHAASCEKCPQGHGRGWCNGECSWSNGKCIPKAMKADSDCYCGLANRNNRIVGGRETEVNEYPWQVLMLTNPSENDFGQCISAKSMCGGSVIGDQWVLTAAHCLALHCGLTPAGVEVYLGEHNIQDARESNVIKVNVAQIINHPNYSQKPTNNDFALLKLTNKIDFKVYPHIRPICLPASGSKNDYNGYMATVTGWGRTTEGGESSPFLQEVDLRVIKSQECRRKGIWQIRDQMLCTYTNNMDSCAGDSGGPVVTKEPSSNGVMPGQNYELIGVVSWGYGCARSTPGVNARVTKQLDWIRKTTAGSWMTCPRS